MRNNIILFLSMLCFTLTTVATEPRSENKTYEIVKQALNKSVEHSIRMYSSIKHDSALFPRSANSAGLITSKSSWWCSGFFPGTLWYLYEYTHNEKLLNAAKDMTARLSGEIYNNKDHDIGFKINSSFGNGYRLINSECYREKIIQAAETLKTRFNKTVGCTRSWNRTDWGFCVIIDNMMNMELFTTASRLSGDYSYLNMAKSHADVTMQNHFRKDFSCYHVVGYDSITGKAQQKVTYQGYSNSSAWSRGQAWALYGYTMMYSETDDIRYLKQAVEIGNFIMNHPRLPEDKVPYWDFDDPNIPDTYRDASSAAIMASAFLELSTKVNDAELSDKFFKIAELQLNSLSSPIYFAEIGTNSNFILKHSVGFFKKNSEVDMPLSYADYYYVEAMIRYLRIIDNEKKEL